MATGRCLCNTGLPDDELVKEFSDLHEDLAEFVRTFDCPKGLTIPMLIRYTVYCYDKNSAVAIEYKSKWIQKKKVAATRAKFPTYQDNGATKFTEESENIIFNKNIPFGQIIVRYLAVQWDSEWEIYCVYRELQHNVMKELQKFDFNKPSDLKTAKQNGEDIQHDIEKLEYRFFSGNEEATLKALLYEDAFKASLELRPEHLATKRENGEQLVDINPYGDGYSVDKLKFLNDE